MKKYFLPILWMIIIFTVSSIPGNTLPEYPFFGFDKLAHILEYSILGFLWARVLKRKIILIILIGTVFGILDEIHQLFVPFRVFSVIDMLCDSTGVILGATCQLLLKKSQLARWKRIAT